MVGFYYFGRQGRRTRRSHARTAVFVLIVFFVRLLRGCSKVYSQHSPCVRDWSGYPFCLHHCIFHPPVSFVDHLLRQGGLRKKRYERKARPDGGGERPKIYVLKVPSANGQAWGCHVCSFVAPSRYSGLVQLTTFRKLKVEFH